ncbi:uncharacterized protein LOC121878569 [Homarus americanus]|uniref:uncharacterized protein LOC121878569 n=1 Tax=Homarus americanus TaxID=6706 RepID=UPI001C47995D|nr:uncharacterized protein LOC121878569 [Homarus americanus]
MLRHSVQGLAVLYTVVLPAACQTCSSTTNDHHGCQTYSLTTPYGNKKCLAVEPDSADFSFYLKPGQDFNFLQVKPPTLRPPPPRSSPGRPSPDQAKDAQSTSTPAGLHPPQAPVITEDEEAKTSSENSPVDDSRKAPNNPGLPWYVPVIITAIVAVIIITIITFLVVRKMNQKKENKFQQKQEKQGKVNYSGPHCSPDRHSEEEIDLQDHIYEEVDDLGPVIYGHPSNTMDEGGVDVRVGGGWMANRGSAHESENSLYVPFN